MRGRGQPAASCLQQFSRSKPSLAVVHFPTRSRSTVVTSPRSFCWASSRLWCYCLILIVPSSAFDVDISWDSHSLLTQLPSLISLNSLLCSVQPCSQVSCCGACMRCVHCCVRERGRACVRAQAVALLWFCLSLCCQPTIPTNVLSLFKACHLQSYCHIIFVNYTF